MFTYICITDGVDYSRITLRFSITRIKPPTTDLPLVPDDLLKVVRVNAKQRVYMQDAWVGVFCIPVANAKSVF